MLFVGEADPTPVWVRSRGLSRSYIPGKPVGITIMVEWWRKRILLWVAPGSWREGCLLYHPWELVYQQSLLKRKDSVEFSPGWDNDGGPGSQVPKKSLNSGAKYFLGFSLSLDM